MLIVTTDTAGEVRAPAAADDEAGIAAAELLDGTGAGAAGDEAGAEEAGVSVVAGAGVSVVAGTEGPGVSVVAGTEGVGVSVVAGIAAAVEVEAGVTTAVLVAGTAYVVVMTLLELSGQLVTLAGQL